MTPSTPRDREGVAALSRAVFAFLVLPGVVTYLLPWLIAPAVIEPRPWRWVGLPFVLVGTAALLRCVRDFFVVGKGTLAPWSPPRHLVTVGLYRRSRNPMYVAIVSILFGWSVWFQSAGLAAYALVVALIFHVRVVVFEEPKLASSFPSEWAEYRRTARRWL